MEGNTTNTTATTTKTAEVVEFDYQELLSKESSLNHKIEKAYGPEGLGICIVRNVPGYVQARVNLLPLGYKLANLPAETLKSLTKPEYMHAIGWSHGVEKFKGKPDVSKGSFYACPVKDIPDELTEDQKKDGAFVAPNVWPGESLPQLEPAFKEMGKIVTNTGALLAYHIDLYVNSVQSKYPKGTLEDIIRNSSAHLARLLHYFPSDQPKTISDDWCGWHNDHGALTGLCSAIFTEADGSIIDPFVDPEGGLFAKNRFADQQRIKIPVDALAFQIGETAQIITGGILEATPHCVVRGQKSIGTHISRNTFACFMQPSFDYVLNVPEGVDSEKALNKDAYNVPTLKGRWEKDSTFLKFSGKTLAAYSLPQ